MLLIDIIKTLKDSASKTAHGRKGLQQWAKLDFETLTSWVEADKRTKDRFEDTDLGKLGR